MYRLTDLLHEAGALKQDLLVVLILEHLVTDVAELANAVAERLEPGVRVGRDPFYVIAEVLLCVFPLALIDLSGPNMVERVR